MKAQGLIGGGLSADTSKDLRMRLGLDMLGVPYQYVTGYRSSPPARLALQRGEIHMFAESPPSYRSVVVPQLIATGIAIPVWYDEIADPPVPSGQLEGLTIPSFPQLYKKIKGTMPSGEYWEAYRTLYEMNNALLRLVALPPGAPREAIEALRRAVDAPRARQGVRRRVEEDRRIRAGIRDRARPERAGAARSWWCRRRCATTSTPTCATFRRSESSTEDAR